MVKSKENKKYISLTEPADKSIKEALIESGVVHKVVEMNYIPISTGYIQPGDVVTFTYKARNSFLRESVVALVVQTNTSHGLKVSRGTGNTLLTCFKIADTPEDQAILNRLYNNKTNSTFRRASRMFKWLTRGVSGYDKFRTYIMDLRHVSTLMELKLKEGE